MNVETPPIEAIIPFGRLGLVYIMEQVRELLDLIKGVKTNGGLVAASFIVCRI